MQVKTQTDDATFTFEQNFPNTPHSVENKFIFYFSVEFLARSIHFIQVLMCHTAIMNDSGTLSLIRIP